MVKIINNYSLDEYASIYNKIKRNFKLISLAIMVLGIISAIGGIVLLFVLNNEGFTWMISISTFFAVLFAFELYALSIGAFKRRATKMNSKIVNGLEINYTFNDNDLIIEEIIGEAKTSIVKRYSEIKPKLIDDYIVIYLTSRTALPLSIKNIKEEDLAFVKSKLGLN